ncbi:D-arabinono-1,4-lactone oxidase [Planifilum fimeticola]|uniref:D-arabinono-1,4-lactone oxidase n=1 Tax=Planifilum fimeticola TaxID=201975 RepID=UPI003CCBFB0E
MFSVSQKEWSNWSGSVRFRPKRVLYPASVEDVARIIREAADEGKQIRVVGSGHSFTPLVPTDILLSLDRLRGLEAVDKERRLVTVRAGTKLKELGKLLHGHGLAQENLGDINAQSIAGAISTGTHGTGMNFGILSTQAAALTLVNARGEVVECSPDRNPELFKAAQVSLGALGVIVRVTLRVLPRYRLHYRSGRMSLTECLNHLDRYRREHRHFEFYWFPHTDQVQVKFMDETDRAATAGGLWSRFSKWFLENGAFWLLSETARRFPRLCPSISRLSARGVPAVEEVGDSHRLFATPRLVRFNEMEYALPAEKLAEVVREIRETIQRRRFAVHFPIECRYVKGDDIWLSPAYGRDTAFVAVHMYRGMPHEAYFSAVEAIFRRHGGRPHWGKMHSLTAEELSRLYPRWNDFCRIRGEQDPEGRFLNSHLRTLFGVPSGQAAESATAR